MFTEFIIQQQLFLRFNHIYQLFNSYVFDNFYESDYFGISKIGYSCEIEIKLSKSDFLAENKKSFKYDYMNKAKVGHKYVCCESNSYYPSHRSDKKVKMVENIQNKKGYCDIVIPEINNIIPNKFAYACPEGIIEEKDLPSYAGLYYICISHKDRKGNVVYTIKDIKQPKFLHKVKFDNYQKLSYKFYNKYYYDYLKPKMLGI